MRKFIIELVCQEECVIYYINISHWFFWLLKMSVRMILICIVLRRLPATNKYTIRFFPPNVFGKTLRGLMLMSNDIAFKPSITVYAWISWSNGRKGEWGTREIGRHGLCLHIGMYARPNCTRISIQAGTIV